MSKLELKVKVQQVGAWAIYYLSGDVTENVEILLEKVSARQDSKVIFDFSGVRSINSSGIADWLEFLIDYAASRKVVYDNCPPQIVDVMNMIVAFHKPVQVRSVLIPFTCTNCQNNWNLQQDLTQPFSAGNLSSTCPSCSNPGELDVDLEEFLAFTTGGEE